MQPSKRGIRSTAQVSHWVLFAVSIFVPWLSFANHGPATSGGGSTTISGDTLDKGGTRFSLDFSYTNYDDISADEKKRRAEVGGDFDGLRDSYLESLTVSHGMTDNLELSAQLGWYSGRGFSETHSSEKALMKNSGHSEEPEVETATGSPEGLTDLLLRAKYRVVRNQREHLSLLGGVILPTGENDQRLSNGEKLEPSSQPGSGAFGYLGGLSYSRHLGSRVAIDASGVYVLRTSDDGFEVGDRIDTGVAVTYSFDDSEDLHPNVGVFIELTHTWLGKDSERGEGLNENSGGNSYYLTSGVRFAIAHGITFMVAPSIPLQQNLNGEQLETDFRIFGQLSATI